MVDAGVAAHFERQGIALLNIDAGAQFFVDELSAAGVGVERIVLSAPSIPGSATLSSVETGMDAGAGDSRQVAFDSQLA